MCVHHTSTSVSKRGFSWVKGLSTQTLGELENLSIPRAFRHKSCRTTVSKRLVRGERRV